LTDTAMYDIVLLILFQLVRIIVQTKFLFGVFYVYNFFHKTRI